MSFDIHPKLKKTLYNINFLYRFTRLWQLYPRVDPILNPDLNLIEDIVEGFGYDCQYNKKHKFYKIQKNGEKPSSLHLSVEQGKVEFILNIEIDTIPNGSTYSVMSLFCGATERVKNPCFSSYEMLTQILKECFSIYEDIILEINKPDQ